jgi:hypothetical protein
MNFKELGCEDRDKFRAYDYGNKCQGSMKSGEFFHQTKDNFT